MGTSVCAVPTKSEDNYRAKNSSVENKQARGRSLGKPEILNVATEPTPPKKWLEYGQEQRGG